MDFKALEQNYQPFKLQQPQKQPKKQKDFWVDQISTAGGILGGIAGLPLGLLGAGGGSALGSGLGEALENKITGDDIGSNVAQEAILGGVFGAGPIKLTKAILGAGKSVASQGTKSAASQATGEPLKTSLQGKLQNLGNNSLLSQYGTIGKPFARSTDPKQTIGELADYGITKPEDVERIAREVTGSSGIINRAVAKSIDKSGGVDTTNLRRIAEDALQLNGVVEKDAKSVMSVVDSQLRKLQGGPAGSLNPLANPNDAIDVIRSLEKRIANLTGKGDNYRLSTPERADQAKALQAVHDEIEDRLYLGAGANKNISKFLTPETRKNLLALQPGNPQWEGYVNRVMGAKSIDELRAAQAPFVKGIKIIGEADDNAITASGRTGNAMNELSLGGIGGAIANVAVNASKPLVARFAGQGLRTTANKVGSNAAASAAPKAAGGLRSALGVAGGVGIAAPIVSEGIDLAQGAAAPAIPETKQAPDLASALNQTASAKPVSASPYPRENLIADIERDPKNADAYIEQYQALQEIYAPADTSSDLNATQLETANRAQNALRDLDVLQSAVESGDILKTAVPGSGSALGGSLLGTTDIEAALFNIGDVILRARTGAQAPESEVRAFISGFLPRGGESKEAQMNKLQRVYRELSGMANPVAGATMPASVSSR